MQLAAVSYFKLLDLLVIFSVDVGFGDASDSVSLVRFGVVLCVVKYFPPSLE